MSESISIRLPIFFHGDQLLHKPEFEWRFGEQIEHPETTRRAESILLSMKIKPDRYQLIEPTMIPIGAILQTHDKKLVQIYQTAASLPPGETFYPSVFPPRRRVKPDPTQISHSGFFCFDSGTPLNNTTFMAASWSAACAYELAQSIANHNCHSGYALCRPPGHHASRSFFGGYCYFNNAAIAAKALRRHGKVCLIDIDFHHGNGTQRIFYEDERVNFISIHGDPKIFYPYYEGHESETGAGKGSGFNHNICLPGGVDIDQYMETLESRVRPLINDFEPDYLVVSAGFDTFDGDLLGGFHLQTRDFHQLGKFFQSFRLPTALIQEGGYVADHLGENVDSFLEGFMDSNPVFIQAPGT